MFLTQSKIRNNVHVAILIQTMSRDLNYIMVVKHYYSAVKIKLLLPTQYALFIWYYTDELLIIDNIFNDIRENKFN